VSLRIYLFRGNIKYSDTLLNTSSSRIHHTIDALVTIAEISYLESKKIKNPSCNLIPKTGIPKKGIKPFLGNKSLENTIQFLFLV
jgi:hypothetical protein